MSYYVHQALDVVKNSVRLAGAETIGVFAADNAIAELWSNYAWRETLAELDPIMLIPGVQDYPEPLANVPEDFAGIWDASLVQLTEDGTQSVTECRVLRHIDRTQTEGLPEAISYQQDNDLFRLSNVPPSNAGAPWFFIEGRYKKLAPRVTNANLAGLLFPFQDEMFSTYISVLRWKFLELLGSPEADQRAGMAVSMMDRKATQRGMNSGMDQLAATVNPGSF